MTAGAQSDPRLVADFVQDSSESAFRAIVARHVDLVYATALRQLGNASLAEEVTQNVFVVLARKAPRLAGIQTLAGWLHRTAILESKVRLRSELRRQQREHKAGEMAALQREGESPMAPLIPLVDEALLHLREHDRTALVLRFLEERSLYEVGKALGINEDAARKRVARALERVARFFRDRGFAVPAGTAAAALLADSVAGAPAALAMTAAQVGIAAGTSVSGINLVLFHLMTLTKTQAVLLGAFVCAVPLAWQRKAAAALDRTHSQLTSQIASTESRALALDRDSASLRESARSTLARTLHAQNRTAHLQAMLNGREAFPIYQWDDRNWLLRIPKEFMERLDVSATSDKRGHLTEQIKEVLQLNEGESELTQTAVERFLAGYREAQGQLMHSVPPAANELNGVTPDDVRSFELKSVAGQIKPLRESLFRDLENALGPDRARIFQNALRYWMPINDEAGGLSSSMAVFDFDHRQFFGRPKPGDEYLTWGVTRRNGGLIRATMAIEDIPDMFRSALQDWIALAQSRPSQP